MVDTLARCMVGDDENAATGTGLFFGAGAERLRQATDAAACAPLLTLRLRARTPDSQSPRHRNLTILADPCTC